MSVFSFDAFDDHEQVTFCNDPETGLKAIIAVHSTKRGPAAGGCRFWDYASDEDALRDVLRLSRGMSYKNAMAGLNLGGGKSVIIGNSATDKSPELLRSFGRFINTLGGKYITAEDVGISVEDMEIVHTQTEYVAGLNEGEAGSGDPSPFTAHGVFAGIKASVKHRFDRDSLDGMKVSVQGLGHVGYYLCKELHEAGAKLVVTDVNQQSIDRVVSDFSATAVDVDAIYDQDVDIYAPCALGATINKGTIDRIKAKVIAGAANNQLITDDFGEKLVERGILYAPDYVINAGGIMNVANEVAGDKITTEQGMKDVEVIYDKLIQVFRGADERGLPTHVVADKIALALINEGTNNAAVAAE